MTPLESYKQACSQHHFNEDPEQVAVLNQLERVYQQLIKENRSRSGLFAICRKPVLVKGAYLWGGVGIGKTFIMDCFYQALPFQNKLRLHFHQFMNLVHAEMKKVQGQKEPLKIIAKNLAKKTQVLCFDEFYVSDVADAMILGRLLEALFAEGVCLIATSNLAPDDLYKNGIQRQHFLPAISLLKKQVTVLSLSGAVDYRLQHLKQAGVFYTPNDDSAQDNMEKSFTLLAEGLPVRYADLELFGRTIPIRKEAGGLIWFDFKVLCGVPRSQQDYLELVKNYHTIFVSDLPVLEPQSRDRVSSFIKLIDVLYDARIRLVLSAETSLDKIYSQGRLHFEYQRTLSRLHEMESETYFLK